MVARGDRDLLAEDGAHAHLERVDRARDPHAAARADQRSQRPVAGERGVDDGRLGVEIEEPAHAREEVHQPVEAGQVDAQPQRGAFGLVPHLDDARRAAELDDAPVDAAASTSIVSTPGIARGARNCEHRRPGERRAVRHPQLEAAVGDEAIGPPAAGAAAPGA